MIRAVGLTLQRPVVAPCYMVPSSWKFVVSCLCRQGLTPTMCGCVMCAVCDLQVFDTHGADGAWQRQAASSTAEGQLKVVQSGAAAAACVIGQASIIAMKACLGHQGKAFQMTVMPRL